MYVVWNSKKSVLAWTRAHAHITRFQQHEPVASILNLRIGVVFGIVVGSPICLCRMMMFVFPHQASMRFPLGLCLFVFNETQRVTVDDDASSRRACESSHPNTTIMWLSGAKSRATIYRCCIYVVIYNGITKWQFVFCNNSVANYKQPRCILQIMVCNLQIAFCN